LLEGSASIYLETRRSCNSGRGGVQSLSNGKKEKGITERAGRDERKERLLGNSQS